MVKTNRKVIIISASSDIGNAMGHRWLSRGWEVFGTFRTKSQAVDELIQRGAKLTFCDLSRIASIRDACSNLRALCAQWDVLIMGAGILEPIGMFIECEFDAWEESIRLNFTSQMRVLHELLPSRHIGSVIGPCVLFFAGGGTKRAPVNYSACTISKIALIKAGDLLDAERKDTRFVIVGPGWVKTKIHNSTLRAGLQAGTNYQHTLQKLTSNEFTPMDDVLNCCDWLTDAPREWASGRNFSVAFDAWGTEELTNKLLQSPDMYKLRRYGNARTIG